MQGSVLIKSLLRTPEQAFATLRHWNEVTQLVRAHCPWYTQYTFNAAAEDARERELRREYERDGRNPPVESMKRVEPGMLLIAHPRASIDRSSDIFDVRRILWLRVA